MNDPIEFYLMIEGARFGMLFTSRNPLQCLESLSSEELCVQKGATHVPCHRIARQLAERNHLSVSSATSVLLFVHVMSGCYTMSYPL